MAAALHALAHAQFHIIEMRPVNGRARIKGDLVSIWGQANVQNELDAVTRVVSSAQEVPFPLEALLVFPRIAWVLCTQQ